MPNIRERLSIDYLPKRRKCAEVGGNSLSSGDLENQPAREVGYYGGVRDGWEKARKGLQEVVEHLNTLMNRDPSNVRLQRYITQVQKLLEKTHKLQMRMGKVRDRFVPRKKKEQPTDWLSGYLGK